MSYIIQRRLDDGAWVSGAPGDDRTRAIALAFTGICMADRPRAEAENIRVVDGDGNLVWAAAAKGAA